ncbi:ECF RNA polymerase sigma factor SigK [Streptomyces sp. NPDC088360]|uniref:ECF RNA polymerase sigma factor SigK n=1 Tax=Streptomyces sp. NPDC088360 TaxID=3154515 RepID=UPI00344CEB98
MNHVATAAKRPESAANLPELMQRVAHGDEDAFSSLYDIVAAPVLRAAHTVLRDPAQSQEVTQEVLVELWHTAPRYRTDRGTVMNWVLTLAHRRAVDRVRSTAACSAREKRTAQLAHTPAFDAVSEEVETRMEHEQLRRCLLTLTEAQRQCLVLAYYQGMTSRQIAERLSLPLGTVKTRLRDGLIRLRDTLQVPA